MGLDEMIVEGLLAPKFYGSSFLGLICWCNHTCASGANKPCSSLPCELCELKALAETFTKSD